VDVIEGLKEIAGNQRDAVYLFLRHLLAMQRPFLLRSDVVDSFAEVTNEEPAAELKGTVVEDLVSTTQETALANPWVCFSVRPDRGRRLFVRCHSETLHFEAITSSEYFAFKERLVDGRLVDDAWPLEIDFQPFSRHLLRLREQGSIGRGGEFLNRRLVGQLFADSERGFDDLFRFLSLHSSKGQQLMINAGIRSVEGLRDAIRAALRYLASQPPRAEWDQVAERLRGLGFEPGWGRTVARMRETMQLLQETLEAPEPRRFEALLSRIPMVFRTAIISPHGYFGQGKVMGLPDTGGQVVYILDQVRALEKAMRSRLAEQGVDFEPEIVVVSRLLPENRGTACNQRLERIAGTESARILRVPFRNLGGEIVPHWISRFAVWPYLERFALEAEKEIQAELGGRPDLIIGNYSDGNLVASLIAQRLGVTQCNIAHALEKTKYVLSDLYWQHNEGQYHFSCQFVADLVAMNAADFIITSTSQEIAGDDQSVGQYESYAAFTMPGLLRVVQGVDVFDSRFNIVSPGVDPDTYYPYSEQERRLQGLLPEIEEMLFDPDVADARGNLAHPERPILLAMARLDRIKNLTGLADWFGANERLRSLANLVIVGGNVLPQECLDAEERAEAERLHEIMNAHELDGDMRWIGRLLDKPLAGELYRFVGDRRGAFVQPALFEAFGLTVIEAMTSGVPTFATWYGGPSEIIEHGVSGFHIDPNHGDQAGDMIADFLADCAEHPDHWQAISDGAVERVRARYTWELYAERLMTLARVYGYWKYVTAPERVEVNRYLQAIYNLMLRPRAAALIEPPSPAPA